MLKFEKPEAKKIPEKKLTSEEKKEIEEINREKELVGKMLEGREVAEKIGAVKREIADRLLPIKTDIFGIKEIFENKSKKKAQDYLNKCSLNLGEIRGIDIWLEKTESIVKETKNFKALKILQEKLNGIREDLKSDKFKLIIESFRKKDLNKLFEADKGDYFRKFEEGVVSSLEGIEEYFRK